VSYIKLTQKALHLMEGEEYLEKINLKLQRATPPQYKVDLPVEWLRDSEGPGQIVIALKSIEDVRKRVPSLPSLTRRHLRIIKTGTRRSDGLYLLEVRLMDGGTILDRVNAVSGAPGAQAFRLPAESPAGSGEPLPEGYWDLGEPEPRPRKRSGTPNPLIEFASGVGGNLSKDWPADGDGLGPVWVSMYCHSWTAREFIGFHVDNNSSFAPGTDGCVGIVNDSGLKSLKKFLNWFEDPVLAPYLAIVDWELGSV
jgi:lysozyme